ncbi:MAG: copper homeostasis protein CutC [Bacteroidetes bacterium HGW-Bacteroidetes-6]|nr:MAG: copper homeostasis protein CutC [Bacteroidetes bacterium HGW-Bacteroidetes-6]
MTLIFDEDSKTMNTSVYKLEICTNSLESVHEAVAGGADRIELCTHLSCGGLTPSAGLLQTAIEYCDIPVNVLIRPRSGNFCYSQHEIDEIARDIVFAKNAGAAGVVCGFLLPDGSIDKELTRRMVLLASPMSFTFHRAFDVCINPFEALETIIAAGCHRLLTSGQENSAAEGKELISKLINQANGRIIVMPGSGVNVHTIESLLATGAIEFHMSGTVLKTSTALFCQNHVVLSSNSEADNQVWVTSGEKVAEVKRFLGK